MALEATIVLICQQYQQFISEIMKMTQVVSFTKFAYNNLPEVILIQPAAFSPRGGGKEKERGAGLAGVEG